jgi:hypothetical protein
LQTGPNTGDDELVTTVEVAVACCRRTDTAAVNDLYPDPDAPLLCQALVDRGALPALLSWDDPGVDWSSYARVVISSTWDSVDHPVEYLAWARRVSEGSRLLNPVAVLAWDIDKKYQLDLAEGGVPLVPTAWVEPGQRWEPPSVEFVVKPAVSAGGRDTARYSPADAVAAAAHVKRLQEAAKSVMVQAYLPSIDVDGEVDLVFIGGSFSHAVHKKPALRLGEGVVGEPWKRMAWTGVVSPNEAQLAVAETTMSIVHRRFHERLAYGRVDLVSDRHGDPLVLEVELIDPYLSLDMAPGAAASLANAILL